MPVPPVEQATPDPPEPAPSAAAAPEPVAADAAADTPADADAAADTPADADADAPADTPADAGRPTDADAAADKPVDAGADIADPAGETVPPRAPVPGADPDQVGRRRRIRYAHALRRAPLPRAAARRVRAWARHPSGRLALPGLLLFMVITATGGAGAFLVPAMAERATPVSEAPPATSEPTPVPELSTLPSIPPGIGGTLGPTGMPVVQRPADVLKAWAAQLSPKVDVPAIALEAYGYAELVAGQTTPGCGLKWTTLAAIGRVESAHGQTGGAVLLADGRSLPAVFGPPLNGTNNTMKILDTDGGVLDGDRVYDRAVGPMQFIPTTWQGQAIDADNDGMADPGDIDDAALAAAKYLCQGGRNMANVGDWWAAILTYNAVQPYARAVYDAANEYGAKSRT